MIVPKNHLEEIAVGIASSLLSQKSAGNTNESLSLLIARSKEANNLSDAALSTLIPLANKVYLDATGADEFEVATPSSVAKHLYGTVKSASMEPYAYKEFELAPLQSAPQQKSAAAFSPDTGYRMNVAKTLKNLSYEEQWQANNQMLQAKSACETLFKQASETLNLIKQWGGDEKFISDAIWKNDTEARDLQKMASRLYNDSPCIKSASYISSEQLNNLGDSLYNQLDSFNEAYKDFKHKEEVLAGKRAIHSTISSKGEVIVNA